MGELIQDVRGAIETTNANARIYDDLGASIIGRLDEKFAHPAPSGELWERLNDSFGCQNDQAWRWISDYVGNQECILAFAPRVEQGGVELADGRELVPVLERCFGFEFYVTNRELLFLLCFNHHDFLIAAGDAKPWLVWRAQGV